MTINAHQRANDIWVLLKRGFVRIWLYIHVSIHLYSIPQRLFLELGSVLHWLSRSEELRWDLKTKLRPPLSPISPYVTFQLQTWQKPLKFTQLSWTHSPLQEEFTQRTGYIIKQTLERSAVKLHVMKSETCFRFFFPS